ncbi:MAG: phosphotransferase [Caldilineaceae bacterium]
MSILQINKQTYRLVCGDRCRGRAVYRGPAAYLRIGLPAVIEHEITIHRRLLALGFPVAPLLQTGFQDGQPFFIEAALGDAVWGDSLEAETHAYGTVRESSFAGLLALILRWTEAQLQTLAPAETHADLAATVRLADVERLLPEHILLTRQVFARAQQRLTVFPVVLTHGDFHPHNLCPGGVIDLEFVHWSVAGYDAITGLFADDLLPPDPTDYRYTATQLANARTAIDALFQRYHLPPPTHYLADFRLCRMMQIVHLAERRSLDVQQWIYQHYVTMATAYLV